MTTYTPAQIKALNAAFEKKGAVFARGSRAGGAYFRCIERMVDLGLLDGDPPYPITTKGLQALRDVRAKKWAAHGCVAYQEDLSRVEAALALVST